MRNWLMGMVVFGISLLLAEIVLSLAASVIPTIAYQISPPWSRNIAPDKVLGYRYSTFYPGHDANGYRNDMVPEQVDILAVGDSLTYGYNAKPADTWPSQLQALTGLSVYNAGVGGYSPPEYEVVVNEMLTLKPKMVLLGLYLGNDIGGAYTSVYVQGRFDELRSQSAEIQTEIEALREAGELRTQAREHGMDITGGGQPAAGAVGWIKSHSSLYGLLRSINYMVETWSKTAKPFRGISDDSFETASHRPGRVPFVADTPERTVFLSPDLTILAVDTGDARMAEGLRITQDVLKRLHDTLSVKGIELIVVLLDHKPFVYEKAGFQLPERFTALITAEKKLKADVEAFLHRRHIHYIDTLPSLSGNLARGMIPYSASDDDHPNATGYAAIAKAIFKTL